jgi:transglutaminase-like putative cysteine protease
MELLFRLVRPRLGCLPLLFAAGVLAALPARAADFPDVTPEERAVASVPGEPNAAAVTLFRKAEFRIGDSMDGDSSTFIVRVRRKILSEPGKSYGEMIVRHSQLFRLKSLQGRTVLPDGKVLPLSDDAVFRRRTSKTERSYETVVAFPAVAVGAILDVQYELKVDTIFMLDPWVFQEEVPVRYAEIVFEIPSTIAAATWTADPMKVGLKSEQTKTLKGVSLKVWGKDLPAVPNEPFGLPFADMASRFMLVPTRIAGGADLFKDWASTCDLFGAEYDAALNRGRNAEGKARELAAAAGPGARARAEALYRFVRDEISTDDSLGIGLGDKPAVDATLKAKHGTSPEKALLLVAMLRELKIEAKPVWAAYRSGGRVDLSLANPWWFDQVLVAATLDGRRLYLHPSDASLAFGALPPDLEGTAALLFDRKKPETFTLPETPFDGSVRRAKVELTVGDDGRMTGKGTLTLTGHHAWQESHAGEEAAKAAEGFKKWLEARYPAFAISDVAVEERLDERRIGVTWSLAEREEEVLGDEVSLQPSRPFGPVTQPFAGSRRSAVLLAYADRDEHELTIRWPAGFRLEAKPAPASLQNAAGALAVELETGDNALTYRRRFDLTAKSYGNQAQFEALRALYGVLEKNDAQALVLARR